MSYPELYLNCPDGQSLDSCIQALDQKMKSLAGPWSCHGLITDHGLNQYRFEYKDRYLYVAPHSEEHDAYVSTIVPTSPGEIPNEEYIGILNDFRDLALDIFDAPAILSTTDPSHFGAAFPLLQRFSGAANKSSGGTHPLDEARFLDFIAASHRDDVEISDGNLTDWLIEDGWPEDSAYDLASKYRFGKDLLERYD